MAGNSGSGHIVTAISLSRFNFFIKRSPVIGAAVIGGTGNIQIQSDANGSTNSYWWSQIYKIGQPFKITKIRIPFAQSISSIHSIVLKVYTDDASGTTYTLQTINNANYPGAYNVVLRSDSSGNAMRGAHNFFLELVWGATQANQLTISLPITIEYELIDD